MHRIFVAITFLFLLSSCKDAAQKTDENVVEEYELVTTNWPLKAKVSPEVKEILEEWPEYKALEVSFDALYNASNKDDLALTLENIIEEQKLLEASTYPIKFDKPQIKSRQKVFKTYVLRVKGDLIYRIDPEQSVIEMINAYNTQRAQFAIVLNSDVDIDLIFDE